MEFDCTHNDMQMPVNEKKFRMKPSSKHLQRLSANSLHVSISFHLLNFITNGTAQTGK